jgi:omega-amidase
MRLGALQFDVARGEVAKNLRAVERGVEQARDLKLDAVCLPEMWPTSFAAGGGPFADERELEELLMETQAALRLVAGLSKSSGIVLVGSAAERDGRQGLPRNRLHVFAAGERVYRYDKLHLFTPTAEQLAFKAGSELPELLDLGPWVVDAPAPKAMGIVCYDLRFGPLMDQVRLAAPEILWVPAQWPAARDAHWRALIQGRAAELQAFVVGANRCGEETLGAKKRPLSFAGNSLIAGPDGALLAEGQGEEGLVWAELDPGAARKLRREVPVSRDRREALYRRWYGHLDLEAAASDPTQGERG